MLNTISSFNVLYFVYFLHLLLLQHGDIERNPGPQSDQIKNLSCCHWNVNSRGGSRTAATFKMERFVIIANGFQPLTIITKRSILDVAAVLDPPLNSLVAQNLSEISQLEAYNSLYKHDFICISETYFDSSILEGYSSFQLDGYKVIRADHLSNTKRGGVCIYYKESRSVRALNLINLSECIICEVSIQNCKGYIGVIYRSPSQNTTEFEEFLSNFEDILNTTASSSSLFTIILGDFNAGSSFSWKNDKTTVEGACLEALTSLHGFHQLISESTHLLPTSTSCIDLIFTDQSNLVVDSGIHSSLNPKCYHQITYCKLNLNIKYPLPYQHLVWDYKRANIESIKSSIELVNWKTLFHNKTVHKQVSIFNETLMNIFSNFIPNKYVTFDDRDPS